MFVEDNNLMTQWHRSKRVCKGIKTIKACYDYKSARIAIIFKLPCHIKLKPGYYKVLII